MQSDPILAEYLYSRELKPALDLQRSVKDEILGDDEMLARIAALNETALAALIRVRVQSLVEELVLRAHPAETIVLRQAIAELSALTDDAHSFAEEHRKRREGREEPSEEDAENVVESV